MTPRPTDSDAFDDDGPSTGTDEALRRLLGDAVADVRPADRLGEIRRRTRRRARGSRRWLPVVAGAGVATAAVVGGVVLLGQLGNEEPSGPAASPSHDYQLVVASAAYFVGDTPTGPRLFREFHSLPAVTGSDAVEQSLGEVDPAGGGPEDPDYSTLWPEGSFSGAEITDDRITVELSAAATDRPAGISEREAWLGIQQVVYTADAAIRRSLPVAFVVDDAPADEVLGVEVEELVERDRQYDVLSPVNISDPVEGKVVKGDWLYAGGTTIEAPREVSWSVEQLVSTDESDGGGIGGAAFGGVAGAGVEGKEGPGWRARISLRGLPPGEYLLTAEVTSTGQASDSPAFYRDTRTFVIR
ncbi:hypothetical protein HNR19_001595 [Nocardioides thalensis]|uniref:Bacterial spore germination immunoglobulin-like domain-containing protein n=1 Tax=Nocardioides thalensis TaxID=1914755 RepID=A0A853C182_9ACTN|nr:GerMN domain-containing protein [Nocardioides thalensis]NYJ00897.1 hypothetical protein [Nocardioides thalensis]